MAASGSAFAQDKVSIGVPNWPSGQATAYVLKAILETYSGTSVDTKPGNNAVIYEAMARGRGDIDVHPEARLPNHEALIDKYVNKEGTVKLAARGIPADQGICVTKKTADEHNIHSVEDLVNPENAKLFDTNGDGKGELWIGGQGWGSTNVERAKAHSYGYDLFFELQTFDESLVLTQLDEAVLRGRPFVFACYTPNHVFAQHELVQLKEPPYDKAKWKFVQPDSDPQWVEKSSVGMAWPPSTLYIAYSKSLEERAPEATKILNRVTLTSDLISSWTKALVVDKRDPEEFGKDWVKNNGTTIEGWLK
jgi:glycine betaine/proline transport system substrate-binding protein